MMVVPCESTRDVGNGHLALCRASPSLQFTLWSAVGASVRDNGTPCPLQRQQLELFDHLPSLMAPDTLLALAVPWHMVAAGQ